MASNAAQQKALALVLANIQRGSGGPKGFSQAQWKQLGAAIPSWGGPTAANDHSSAVGTLKSLGSTVMNTLSVPQAMMFTLGSKTIDALSGGKFKSTMGWDEMMGGFSDNYHGYKEILEQVGVPKNSGWSTWGGMAGDIALDPMWLTGLGKMARVPGQVAKAGEAIADTVRGGATVAADLGKVSKDAGTAAMLSKFKDSQQTAKAVKTAIVARDGAPLLPAKKAHLPVYGNLDVAPEARGGAEVVTKTGERLHNGYVSGVLVDGRYLIHQTVKRSRKAGGHKAEFRVTELTDPKQVAGHDHTYSPKFNSRKEAQQWVSEEVARAGEVREPKLLHMEGTGQVKPSDYLRGLEMNRQQVLNTFDGAEQNLGLKLGVGRRNPNGGKGLTGWNYTVNTHIPMPANKALGQVTKADKALSWFRRPAFDQGVHQVARSAHEQQTAIMGEQVEAARRAFGLTHEQSRLVGEAAGLGNLSHPGIEGEVHLARDIFIQRLQREGQWTNEMSQAMEYALKRVAQTRKMEGKGSVTFRGIEEEQAAFDDAVKYAYDDAIRQGATKEEAEAAAEQVAADWQSYTRGEYIPQGQTTESLRKYLKKKNENPSGRGSHASDPGIRDTGRSFTGHLAYGTKDEWVAKLTKDGVDESVARDMANTIEAELERIKKYYPAGQRETVGFAKESTGLQAETDVFKLLGMNDKRFVHESFLRVAEQLAIDAGLAIEGKAGKGIEFVDDVSEAMYKKALRSGDGGILAKSKGMRRYMNLISGFKMYLTTTQIQHYFGNLVGDMYKNFVAENKKAWKFPTSGVQFAGNATRGTKGSKYAKMASGNAEAVDEHFITLGDHEYTGAEIYFMSHMTGLGKGYAGSEIAALRDVASESTKKGNFVSKYARWSARQNAVREDANRIQTWVRHMEAGQDPMTAGMNTIRTHFDYTDLTDFEKQIMRNFILFYTWMRKNIPFQYKSAAFKPGLYNAYGRMEADRPKMPGEPEWLSEMGLVPIPGWGATQTFAPYSDMFKVPIDPRDTPEFIRKQVFGAMPPPVKQIAELATQRDFFTGADLSHKSTTEQGLRALKQMLGPAATQYNRVTGEGASMNPLDLLTNLTGVGRRQRPEQYAKHAAKAAKRKAQE